MTFCNFRRFESGKNSVVVTRFLTKMEDLRTHEPLLLKNWHKPPYYSWFSELYRTVSSELST